MPEIVSYSALERQPSLEADRCSDGWRTESLAVYESGSRGPSAMSYNRPTPRRRKRSGTTSTSRPERASNAAMSLAMRPSVANHSSLVAGGLRPSRVRTCESRAGPIRPSVTRRMAFEMPAHEAVLVVVRPLNSALMHLGVGWRVSADQSGHSTAAMQKHYSHGTPESRRQAAATLQAALDAAATAG